MRIPLLLTTLLLTGCNSVNLSRYAQQKDPLEAYNRSMYAINDALDRAVIKPVARGYVVAVPGPARLMVTNFFSNLDDVVVTANDLLQFKLRQAASDGSRVLFNTTFGLLGLLNVTQNLDKHDEDFGQTLGYWGVPAGPYLVLPVLGPSSIRDSAGLYGDSFFSVISNYRHVATRNTVWVVKGVNARANFLQQESVLEEAVIDRYSFIRDAYLMRRQSQVYDGNPPRRKFDDDDEE